MPIPLERDDGDRIEGALKWCRFSRELIRVIAVLFSLRFRGRKIKSEKALRALDRVGSLVNIPVCLGRV
jgi:hypothetical protein